MSAHVWAAQWLCWRRQTLEKLDNPFHSLLPWREEELWESSQGTRWHAPLDIYQVLWHLSADLVLTTPQSTGSTVAEVTVPPCHTGEYWAPSQRWCRAENRPAEVLLNTVSGAEALSARRPASGVWRWQHQGSGLVAGALPSLPSWKSTHFLI